jgi:hypothetical protein
MGGWWSRIDVFQLKAMLERHRRGLSKPNLHSYVSSYLLFGSKLESLYVDIKK